MRPSFASDFNLKIELTDRNTEIKDRNNFFALNFEFFAKTEPGVSRLRFY